MRCCPQDRQLLRSSPRPLGSPAIRARPARASPGLHRARSPSPRATTFTARGPLLRARSPSPRAIPFTARDYLHRARSPSPRAITFSALQHDEGVCEFLGEVIVVLHQNDRHRLASAAGARKVPDHPADLLDDDRLDALSCWGIEGGCVSTLGRSPGRSSTPPIGKPAGYPLQAHTVMHCARAYAPLPV